MPQITDEQWEKEARTGMLKIGYTPEEVENYFTTGYFHPEDAPKPPVPKVQPPLTTIQLTKEFADKLKKYREGNETYEEILKRLLKFD